MPINKLLIRSFTIAALIGGLMFLTACLSIAETQSIAITTQAPTKSWPELTEPPVLIASPPTPSPYPTITPSLSQTPTPNRPGAGQPVVAPTVYHFPDNVLLLSPTPTPIPLTSRTIIGYSVQQRPIVSYRLGTGPVSVVFIGGIHGGYEWNTIILAYEALDYLMDNLELIPDSVTVYIIPSANPDGQFLTTGKVGRFMASDVSGDTFSGRFNANGVDLNRNWDCDWSSVAYWRQEQINSGPYPFSEPENLILREYLLAIDPAAVVFWHSAANAVFAAGCSELYPPSRQLAQIYGRAANYPVRNEFTSYAITGDATNWLATRNIPAISVELINRFDTDWAQNRAGVLALLNFFDCCDFVNGR
jgi:predicted deacylase